MWKHSWRLLLFEGHLTLSQFACASLGCTAAMISPDPTDSTAGELNLWRSRKMGEKATETWELKRSGISHDEHLQQSKETKQNENESLVIEYKRLNDLVSFAVSLLYIFLI